MGKNNELNPLRWKALFLLALAQFIVIMDTSIIGVALPAIKDSLGYSQAGLQWIFNAYVIIFGGFLLLGGRLSDIFGQRKMFMLGFTILTLASVLTGVAWSEATLNIGRGLQGFGSALIAPSALSILMGLFKDPKELNKAFGVWGAAAAAGGSAGVFLGGVITEWLSWRWVFLINVPIGIIVLILSLTILAKGVKREGKVDYLGSILVTISLVSTVFAIVRAEVLGWGSIQIIGTLVLAVISMFLFLVIQNVKKEPLIPLGIFKAPNLIAGNIITALLAGSWIPLWFFLNLYLQQILGYSAFKGGLALLPMTILIMILMVGVTGKLMAKFGIKPNMIAGLILLGISLILFSMTPIGGNFVLHVLPASLIGALGMALSYIPATVASMSGAKPEEAGLASGLVNTSYQVGSAIGLAIVVAISSRFTNINLQNGIDQVIALNNGFHSAFIGAAFIAGIGALASILFIKKG